MMTSLRESNFIWLTFCLAAMMFMRALTDEFPGFLTLHIIEFVNIALLLIALHCLTSDKSWYRSQLAVLTAMFVVVIAQSATPLKYLDLAYLMLSMVFIGSATYMVGKQVLMTGSVSMQKMIGSIAVYILLGLIWSAGYGVVLQFSPNALSGIEYINWHESAGDLTYFSFVTLTSLGYGDVSPVTPIAKVVVVLEAMTGMLYLAIVVASLVGALQRDD